jgi:RND family efflux transporter MFP subunit
MAVVSDQHQPAPRAGAGRPAGPRPRLGRRLALGMATLLIGGGVFAGWQYLDSPPAHAQPAGMPPPPVTVSTPLQRKVVSSTTFTGQFSAVDAVELRAQVSGYLTEIHFTDGQIVRKGDLLFVIDPRPYDIQLQQATAQYQTATAALDLANQQLKRAAELQRRDFESRDVLDQRVQAQRSAQASIDQATAAIHSAQLNLEFSRVTAPFSGRIGAHQVSIGSLINGGAGAASSTLLATIVSLDPIHLDFDMSETDYLEWRRFQAARDKTGETSDPSIEAALSDEQGWPRRGVLDFIDNQLDRSSGTIHARASLPNPDLMIAPGQFARLRLPTSDPREALLVPDASIVTDQSNKLVMVVAPDGTVVPKQVQIGELTDGLRVIKSGLAASDRVVINGLVRARPGTKVTPQPGTIAVAASE